MDEYNIFFYLTSHSDANFGKQEVNEAEDTNRSYIITEVWLELYRRSACSRRAMVAELCPNSCSTLPSNARIVRSIWNTLNSDEIMIVTMRSILVARSVGGCPSISTISEGTTTWQKIGSNGGTLSSTLAGHVSTKAAICLQTSISPRWTTALSSCQSPNKYWREPMEATPWLISK